MRFVWPRKLRGSAALPPLPPRMRSGQEVARPDGWKRRIEIKQWVENVRGWRRRRSEDGCGRQGRASVVALAHAGARGAPRGGRPKGRARRRAGDLGGEECCCLAASLPRCRRVFYCEYRPFNCGLVAFRRGEESTPRPAPPPQPCIVAKEVCAVRAREAPFTDRRMQQQQQQLSEVERKREMSRPFPPPC